MVGIPRAIRRPLEDGEIVPFVETFEYDPREYFGHEGFDEDLERARNRYWNRSYHRVWHEVKKRMWAEEQTKVNRRSYYEVDFLAREEAERRVQGAMNRERERYTRDMGHDTLPI